MVFGFGGDGFIGAGGGFHGQFIVEFQLHLTPVRVVYKCGIFLAFVVGEDLFTAASQHCHGQETQQSSSS